MRLKISFILIVVLVFAIFWIRTARFNRRAQSPQPPALDRVIDEVHFHQTPLEDVFAELSRKSGLRMDADWGKLSEIGIKRNTPVTVRLFDLRVSRLLSIVLSLTPKPAHWLARDDRVEITTGEGAPAELRMYDVQQPIDSFATRAYYRDRGEDLIGQWIKSTIPDDPLLSLGAHPQRRMRDEDFIVAIHRRLFMVRRPWDQRAAESSLATLQQIQTQRRAAKIEDPIPMPALER